MRCEAAKKRLEPMSEERAGIIAYLEWAARIEVGTVLSEPQREGVRFAAAWIRNRLDLDPRD